MQDVSRADLVVTGEVRTLENITLIWYLYHCVAERWQQRQKTGIHH